MRAMMVPLGMDLVRYGDPELVEEESQPNRHRDDSGDGVSSKNSFRNTTGCDDLLDCIFPPKEWEDNGIWWRQKVSHRPATRADVVELIDTLNTSLEHFQARKTEICPIRSAVYSQCFDEMIRQVTLDSAERGFLLIKVRNELQMTMDAYKLLYKSGVSFDAKVSAESAIHDNELDDLQKQIAELNAEKQKITDDLEMANTIYDKVQRMDIKQQDSDVEIDHLKKSNQQIKTLLKFMNEL